MQNLERQLQKALSLSWEESFDGDLDYQTPQIPIRAEAAVLILINNFENAPSLLLTRRTEKLRLHSGQVAFPGGRVDKTDKSPYFAARREAWEEIGLPQDHPLNLIGELSHHKTITGFDVAPFVAINNQPFQPIPEEGEVAEIFEIPFELLKTENFEIGSQDWQGQKRHYFVLPYKDYFIWGATARMLHQLAARLQNV